MTSNIASGHTGSHNASVLPRGAACGSLGEYVCRLGDSSCTGFVSMRWENACAGHRVCASSDSAQEQRWVCLSGEEPGQVPPRLMRSRIDVGSRKELRPGPWVRRWQEPGKRPGDRKPAWNPALERELRAEEGSVTLGPTP